MTEKASSWDVFCMGLVLGHHDVHQAKSFILVPLPLKQGSKTRSFRFRLGWVGTGTTNPVPRPVHESTYCIVLLDLGLIRLSRGRVGPESRPSQTKISYNLNFY